MKSLEPFEVKKKKNSINHGTLAQSNSIAQLECIYGI